jgi:predicted ATPase/class 3 adenylate cyclase
VTSRRSDVCPVKICLLLTDIEGSTALLEKSPEAYGTALRQHHEILRKACASGGGKEFQDAGDGFFFAFSSPAQAAGVAIEMQRNLASAAWPEEIGMLHVRMAVHWAEAEFREGQYRGPAVHTAARLLSAGHGGQILCSRSAADELGSGWKPLRLGSFRLRGFKKAEDIFQINGERNFPPPRVEQARKHNLPSVIDTFVGRDHDMGVLLSLLSPPSPARLVTLTGAGGTGKTRLAVAAAYALLDAYEHGILYVPLADVPEMAMIPGAILEAAGATLQVDREGVKQISEILGSTPLLMILDNFEHLAGEGGALVCQLRRELPLTRFLITSRLRLAVEGEKEVPLSPLSLPSEDETRPDRLLGNECVLLFAERAASARPGFRLDAGNVGEVASVCRLLEGLPLAIELAAARLQVLEVTSLRDELESDFGSLGGANGGIAKAFEWSRRLLPPDIADFLSVLSVFRGGWTAAAAATVGGLSEVRLALAYLHYLLTCSLIRVMEGPRGMRFSMLEPIRQLAGQSLMGERDEVLRRHRDQFFLMARRVNSEFQTGKEEALAGELELETANVLAAIEGEPANQPRLFAAVDFHQFARCRSCNRKVRALLTEIRPDGGTVEVRTLARAWNAAGTLDHAVLDLASAEQALSQAIDLFSQSGEKDNVVRAHFNLGLIARERGRLKEAFESFALALDYFEERNSKNECAVILLNLGDLALKLGNLDEAEEKLKRSARMCGEVGNISAKAQALSNLGEARLAAGRLGEAASDLVESLSILCKLGEVSTVPHVLALLAKLALAARMERFACYFWGAATKVSERSGAGSAETADELLEVGSKCRAALSYQIFLEESEKGGDADTLAWTRAAFSVIEALAEVKPRVSFACFKEN